MRPIARVCFCLVLSGLNAGLVIGHCAANPPQPPKAADKAPEAKDKPAADGPRPEAAAGQSRPINNVQPPPAEPPPPDADVEEPAEAPAAAHAPPSATPPPPRRFPALAVLAIIIVFLAGLWYLARIVMVDRRRWPRPRVLPPLPAKPPPPLPGVATTPDLPVAICERPLKQPPPLPGLQPAWEQRWSADGPQTYPPRFFLARLPVTLGERRLCRVYVLERELLVLHAGPDRKNNMALTGFVVGGLVGAVVGSVIANAQNKKAESRLRYLDEADHLELVRLAREEKESFGSAVDELEQAVLEPPTWWQRMTNTDCVVYLHLHHRDCGQIVLELPSQVEAQAATELLAAVLGARFSVNGVWDEYHRRYVAKRRGSPPPVPPTTGGTIAPPGPPGPVAP